MFLQGFELRIVQPVAYIHIKFILVSISFAENVICDYVGCGTAHLTGHGSAIDEILPVLLNPAVHDSPTLRQTDLIHILPYFVCKYSFNSVLVSFHPHLRYSNRAVSGFSVAQLSSALRCTPEGRG